MESFKSEARVWARREDAPMCQATLRTGRLRLVPLSDEHLEYEVELDADHEVMRYLGDGRARSREDVERRHQHRLAAARRVVGLGWWILEPPERAGLR